MGNMVKFKRHKLKKGRGASLGGLFGKSSRTTIALSGLSATVTPEEIYGLFRKFGRVLNYGLDQYKPGNGYVCYSSLADAQRAMSQMKGRSLGGQNFYAEIEARAKKFVFPKKKKKKLRQKTHDRLQRTKKKQAVAIMLAT